MSTFSDLHSNNSRLIFSFKKQDADPSPIVGDAIDRKYDQYPHWKKSAPIIGVGLFLIPFFAYAGNTSIFDTTIRYDRKTAEAAFIRETSQTITLLTPAVHVDPNPAKGGGDIEILDDSALLASGSINGESVDIDPIEIDQGQISVYEVRVGDTLSQIASMFNVTTNTIRWANDLKGPISPGETLVILPISGIEHTIKKGETLAGIAKKYKANTEEIRDYNDISGELAVGTKIVVPNAEPEPPKVVVKATKKSSASQKSSSVQGSSWLTLPTKGIRTQGIHGYNAVDIGAPAGTPIYAAAAGTVIISRSGSWNGGYGNYIVVKHSNGVQTLYAHNTTNFVSAGQWVNQGQKIATVGSTGKSTGNHLHFEVRGGRNPF